MRSWIRVGLVPGAVIAFAHLGILGILIGWNGGSRAYGRPETLFAEHLPAVLAASLAALALAVVAGRRAKSRQALAGVAAGVLAADVLAGLAVAAGIGEITFRDLPQVVFVETAAGTQLLAAGLGLTLGSASGRRTVEPEISAAS